MKVTDFMPVCACGREEMEEAHELYRQIEIIKGKVDIRVIFDPRFDYARAETRIRMNNKGIIAIGNNETVVLSCSRQIDISDDTGMDEWTLSEGETVWLHVSYGMVEPVELVIEKAEKALLDTETYWKNWLNMSETGRTTDLGSYRENTQLSHAKWKLFTYL